jgi:hypothetical protein
VVEEKRSLIEVQLREELYGTASQPLCVGKKDEEGNWLFPSRARSIRTTSPSPSASGCCATTTTTICAATWNACAKLSACWR